MHVVDVWMCHVTKRYTITRRLSEGANREKVEADAETLRLPHHYFVAENLSEDLSKHIKKNVMHLLKEIGYKYEPRGKDL